MPDENRFKRVHLETYGKSGIRRVIPGEYLAADPKGRACMIASIEKNKLVYVLNRTANESLTISSPLEAHKPHALVFDLVALDVGYENPVFAALEIDYGESDADPTGQAYASLDKELVYYELDLGLNHVVRKWSEPVDRSANKLFQVPGGADGPSGVLVCSEDFIVYHHSNQYQTRIQIPRRQTATEDTARKRRIVSGTMHKMRGIFFFLLQTNDGDVFKLTMDLVKNEQGKLTGEVGQLNLKFFDTIPVARSLCIMKSGFLFAASESGDHGLYQVMALGDESDDPVFSSESISRDFPQVLYPDSRVSYEVNMFKPRPFQNIDLASSLNSLHPLMGLQVVNLEYQEAPELYAICGAGPRSTFRNVRHGLQVTELIAQGLPEQPVRIFTTRLRYNDAVDAYIVLAYQHNTLVLGVGDYIEEISDSGINTSVTTLAIQQMGEDSVIQVFPKGIRHISATGGINDWDVPQYRTIVAVATNTQQVAVALSSGHLVYFEMDQDGELNEYGESPQMPSGVTALAMGEVPEGRQRSPYLAVACDNSTVRILSLDPDSTLENKSIQAISAPACSLCIMSMVDSFSGSPTLYLHIGLTSGVYIRTILDEITGDLSDTRSRFLGVQPVKLYSVQLPTQRAILALTSKSWLGYADEQTKMFTLAPLDYPALQSAWSFHSDQCPHGIIGVDEKKQLRFIQTHKLDTVLRHVSVPLENTPRAFVKHPDMGPDSIRPYFYIIEADNNTLSARNRKRLKDEQKNGDVEELPPKDFGLPKADRHWASCLQIVNPLGYNEARGPIAYDDDEGRLLDPEGVIDTLYFEDDECPTAITALEFEGAHLAGRIFVVVGTAQNLVVSPRSFGCGFLHVYEVTNGGRSLEFIHKTRVDAPPTALGVFKGRILAGIGSNLVMYSLGIKQMLRKAQARNAVPNLLTSIEVMGYRIICGDIQESVTYVVYKPNENKLIPFADDSVARWTTCTTMVDYRTVAGGDKFGNLWLVRVPEKASEEADEEGAAGHLLNERGYLGGTPNRVELLIHNFVNDIPTSLTKAALVSGQKEMLIYSGLQGTIGALIPFDSREDANFFQSLESEMRKEDPPLAGRDHLVYRGQYVPVKGVVDGDLCERFFLLSHESRERIAAELDRSVREVVRKVSDMRTKFAF
ncbi:hypothetical protein, variant [Verruconis gallopava]|nr:hypothetical protein, variant [Verruconis gallopava]KIW05001.1 hypothetical protein, variant [Verruconis gallopava]